jgi:general transcription factor 3C polypeptide 1
MLNTVLSFKLLRIVMIPHVVEDHLDKSAQAGVAYALELNPYIDEPDLDPPSTISAHVLNLGPSPRHYFKLSSKESLEEYWKSLEYFYRGSESKIARRIFPGSTVPEVL